ncbi:unnamed protein product [Amoebophrya sp. A120]|nr:unnamed protein product [Amoebophrya sp. A120]|eukprot:GSA120T00002314001.1
MNRDWTTSSAAAPPLESSQGRSEHTAPASTSPTRRPTTAGTLFSPRLKQRKRSKEEIMEQAVRWNEQMQNDDNINTESTSRIGTLSTALPPPSWRSEENAIDVQPDSDVEDDPSPTGMMLKRRKHGDPQLLAVSPAATVGPSTTPTSSTAPSPTSDGGPHWFTLSPTSHTATPDDNVDEGDHMVDDVACATSNVMQAAEVDLQGAATVRTKVHLPVAHDGHQSRTIKIRSEGSSIYPPVHTTACSSSSSHDVDALAQCTSGTGDNISDVASVASEPMVIGLDLDLALGASTLPSPNKAPVLDTRETLVAALARRGILPTADFTNIDVVEPGKIIAATATSSRKNAAPTSPLLVEDHQDLQDLGDRIMETVESSTTLTSTTHHDATLSPTGTTTLHKVVQERGASRELEQDLCCICLDSEPDPAHCLPCGHSNMCADCATQLVSKVYARCPYCRMPFRKRTEQEIETYDKNLVQNGDHHANNAISLSVSNHVPHDGYELMTDNHHRDQSKLSTATTDDSGPDSPVVSATPSKITARARDTRADWELGAPKDGKMVLQNRNKKHGSAQRGKNSRMYTAISAAELAQLDANTSATALGILRASDLDLYRDLRQTFQRYRDFRTHLQQETLPVGSRATSRAAQSGATRAPSSAGSSSSSSSTAVVVYDPAVVSANRTISSSSSSSAASTDNYLQYQNNLPASPRLFAGAAIGEQSRIAAFVQGLFGRRCGSRQSVELHSDVAAGAREEMRSAQQSLHRRMPPASSLNATRADISPLGDFANTGFDSRSEPLLGGDSSSRNGAAYRENQNDAVSLVIDLSATEQASNNVSSTTSRTRSRSNTLGTAPSSLPSSSTTPPELQEFEEDAEMVDVTEHATLEVVAAPPNESSTTAPGISSSDVTVHLNADLRAELDQLVEDLHFSEDVLLDSRRVLCPCGETMQLVSARSAYSTSLGCPVECDMCNRAVRGRTQLYHCPAERVGAHPFGFDLCRRCATGEETVCPEVDPISDGMLSGLIGNSGNRLADQRGRSASGTSASNSSGSAGGNNLASYLYQYLVAPASNASSSGQQHGGGSSTGAAVGESSSSASSGSGTRAGAPAAARSGATTGLVCLPHRLPAFLEGLRCRLSSFFRNNQLTEQIPPASAAGLIEHDAASELSRSSSSASASASSGVSSADSTVMSIPFATADSNYTGGAFIFPSTTASPESYGSAGNQEVP